MQLGELFSKLCASTARSARPRVAPILAERRTASRNWTCWVGDGGFDPADHRVRGAVQVPFLRAENVGRKPVPDPGLRRNLSAEAEPDRQRQHHHPPGRGDRHPGVLHGGGRWNFNRRDFGRGRGGVRARSRAVEGERREQAWMRKEATAATRARSGVKVTACAKPRRRRQLRTTRKGARRSPTRSTRSSARSAGGRAGRRHFLCARGILGLELLGEEDLFKGACPRSSGASPSRCSTTRISAACPKTWRPRGGRAQAAPCSRRPSPGAGYDLRIDTGEVIGSGLYWNHSWPTCRAFRGRDGTPSGRAPGVHPAGQRSPA